MIVLQATLKNGKSGILFVLHFFFFRATLKDIPYETPVLIRCKSDQRKTLLSLVVNSRHARRDLNSSEGSPFRNVKKIIYAVF